MSSQGNGQQIDYRVIISEYQKMVVKQRHLEAIEAGKGGHFLAAMRQIVERLRKDPLVFGEPLYNLPALQLLVRQGIVLPLVVDYAVHEGQRFVFIRGFKVLS